MNKFTRWIIDDLEAIENCRKALDNIPAQIKTLELKKDTLKATTYDKDVVDGGVNHAEDAMIVVLQKQDELAKNYKATQAFIKEQERLLGDLDDDERTVLENMYVSRVPIEDIKDRLHIEQSQVYNIRNRAFKHLAQLRFGKVEI